MTDAPLLDVENLWVKFRTRTGVFDAVRGISFTLGKERLGIVGESGSGKSMTGRAVLRLIRPPGFIEADKLNVHGEDILSLPEKQMRRLRGGRVSMIMQDPKFSLNPVMTVGHQLVEALRAHEKVSRSEAYQRALDVLDEVAIRDPKRVFDLYPHEVSGGMGQRIMIAMMLLPNPEILIADEPTSALDVSVQLQVLDIIDKLVSDRGMGLMFISHDLNLVAKFCDRIVIMYAGRIVETCKASELRNAKHPYTLGLLNSVPDLEHPRAHLEVLKRDPAWREAPSVSARQ
ncbi:MULTISPECIES: ABC transporter ATP-binding protein [Marivita]|uniref:ABC transporter ATP-binding protein n=1 Tax=Marivita cryptomonadis TaxID=505252 RepID=A0A9Q2P2F9_9RHOB|nr:MULTISPECIES: ABC transporter ATP-binding protein [Marivita]MCR9169866.1 ABC transporter ATP-binding protein [Paracoccaceae bacterium]MBM2324050.1 ABC transporter ATP-binding protein [Marivita cryptomonadis]MBM2333640.1 ABC transporter ATP-binding protein [Marivita cryptomonadis]MBM2343217.1 ABC transporter ATP-binding protein [Marivita cryptomonadis]MBM2347889.1 ABC transporter ATP-binding protein [Marivita cryptomonadis]